MSAAIAAYLPRFLCLVPFFLFFSLSLSLSLTLSLSLSLSLFLSSVNRRMDEWVYPDRIDICRGSVDEAPKERDTMLEAVNGRERKVTRNLKRKHDEINHIQKVRGPCFHETV